MKWYVICSGIARLIKLVVQLTVLIEYLTVLLEHITPCNSIGRTFGWAWALPAPPLAMPLAICSKIFTNVGQLEAAHIEIGKVLHVGRADL